MLSSASQYAIRSILYLAMYTDESNKVGAKKIADDLEVPQPFLAKLLQQLTKTGLISSTKGPKGGFFLEERGREKSVWDVVKSIDGEDKFDQCFMGLAKCSDENPCPVHFIVSPFKGKILYEFKEKTIDEFVKKIKLSNKRISLKDLDILETD